MLASGATKRLVSIATFASWVGNTIGITSSAVGITICAVTAGIKKYMSIIKKKKEKHDKIVLLAKNKLNNIEFLIYWALVISYFSHYEFVSVNYKL